MSTYREESLPETLQDMSDRFGKPFVRHMIERFGGITLIIPAKSRKDAASSGIVRLLGAGCPFRLSAHLWRYENLYPHFAPGEDPRTGHEHQRRAGRVGSQGAE